MKIILLILVLFMSMTICQRLQVAHDLEFRRLRVAAVAAGDLRVAREELEEERDQLLVRLDHVHLVHVQRRLALVVRGRVHEVLVHVVVGHVQHQQHVGAEPVEIL